MCKELKKSIMTSTSFAIVMLHPQNNKEMHVYLLISYLNLLLVLSFQIVHHNLHIFFQLCF
uniref:Putative ovule protein n=1 Tax=Solanum chacoense TaxID=4108 RepID=A0A0V0H4E5_SOLCH